MRTLTTDYNATAYASATSYMDKGNGQVVTIPANEPEKVRAMEDSVLGGAYVAGPTEQVTLPATATKAAAATQAVTCTVKKGLVAFEGARVHAVSSDVTKGTVNVASALTNSSGVAAFTVTAVATGEATFTFTCGAYTDTLVLTIS